MDSKNTKRLLDQICNAIDLEVGDNVWVTVLDTREKVCDVCEGIGSLRVFQHNDFKTIACPKCHGNGFELVGGNSPVLGTITGVSAKLVRYNYDIENTDTCDVTIDVQITGGGVCLSYRPGSVFRTKMECENYIEEKEREYE